MAEGNRRVASNRTRLRFDGGVQCGKPCFTFLKENVVILIPLKEACASAFFKSALLKDPKRILQRAGEHTQAGRWIKFTSVKEVTSLRSTLTEYIYEAIEIEESGKKLKLKKPSDYAIPKELQVKLDEDAILKAAFEALTPGRRKSYIFHISSACFVSRICSCTALRTPASSATTTPWIRIPFSKGRLSVVFCRVVLYRVLAPPTAGHRDQARSQGAPAEPLPARYLPLE